MQVTQRFAQMLTKNVGRVIVGKENAVELMMIALLCRGHVLIEDVPGLGKTTLASALARSLDCSFKRIQFTPDITPSDITGFSIANFKTGELEYRPGMIMSQIVLADEINRTSPKTQSSLLEVMEEGQVSVDGVTYAMPRPFIVLATQNPVDFVGTYPLPEAQVDRFMLKVVIGYPKKAEERQILHQQVNESGRTPAAGGSAILKPADILKAREVVREVYMDEKIENYITDIVFATRYPGQYGLDKMQPLISYGASPRGSISLASAAKAYAFMKRRGYVIPEDVRAVAMDVLRHRVGLTYEAEAENVTSEEVVSEVLNRVDVP